MITFLRYQNDASAPYSLSNDSVRAILEDSTGTLWVGTDAGLNKFDERTQQFRRYLHDPQTDFSLSHSEMFAIAEDAQGLLWIGTMAQVLDAITRAFSRSLNRDVFF